MATDVVWRGRQLLPILAPTHELLATSDHDVAVREVATPSYRLVFSVQGSVDGSAVVRSLSTAEIAAAVQRYRAHPHEANSAADRAMQRWITKHKTPPRDDLIRWLLARMVLLMSEPPTLVLLSEVGLSKAHVTRKQPLPLTPRTIVSPFADGDDDEPLPPFSPKSGAAPEDASDDDDEAPPPFAEKVAPFEPAAVRSQRSTVVASSRWADDAWRLALELRKSKADVEKAKELRRRQEVVATARKQSLLASASRLRTSAKTDKRDKRLVKDATHKAIEHHEMAAYIEKQTRREYIQYMREHERTTRLLQIGQRRHGQKGPHLGPGPLPTDVYATARDDDDDETEPFVYDIHGRRHAVTSADEVRAKSVFDAAMRKVQRIAAKAGRHLVALFRQHDVDRSGTLNLTEFAAALQSLHVQLSADQLHALFSFFDANDSDGIDYGELLWSFFNRRAFLKKWQMATESLSPVELHARFYAADRARRGALSARDFFLAMQQLGFRFSDLDETLLLHKFDANGDGFIDFDEFQRAFHANHAPAANPARAPTPQGSMTSLESELQALEALQSKLQHLLQQV
ncbi:hypothetical protein SPRG_03602 [Saprolegnia parasitica CBS 223.65]|uniref:EF-hand domain-containing protein n=1 Tax=Saprolegnia parasitica (strain CBS 223.65) TaxID=695850 RepID=A0A067CLZ8_SAPPC|nr:hypothetical protein SPRG_03602 [Saprolegnia parasitica CBS 223.65]KDO31684.1 hypothetical protein SPRG_03602 [Saprolegnia parasitica CBS 223.65]|eukprot:XP_012197570.1 hypothetical protein SPRG_03602 [Saprolegnia parasitica CBS 223.65]